ncbi:chromosome segregation protein SMC [Candidatus Woesearchaeota archaeon]|nr:chromosome segregation protein SMC [Candidatus Woesearchaeota archaeon]
MTKINKLLLHGFKSFARRTELVFGEKFNCILGPNGSGKSNISDAICFVLGKSSAKALRTEKSANLIYNGGKTKKPAPFAEVSIFFDNSNAIFPTEEKEVKVSRIVKSNGQSVYRINDETRTRQQILDLMSLARIDPDGYNIILQGDIVRFVEMPPEERRMLVEEIAGISIYEDKKQKAINELNRVEEKLKECEIILGERANNLKELQKERDQATKFKELNDKIKVNKASLLHLQMKRKREEKNEFDAKIKEAQDDLAAKQKELDELKAKIKAKREDIERINKEIEEKGEKEQVNIHKEVERLKIDIASSQNRTESITAELGKIKQRKHQLKQNIDEVQDKITSLDADKADLLKQITSREKELDTIAKRLDEFKKKNQLDSAAELEKEIEAIDKQLEEKEKEIQELRAKQQEFLRQKDKLEFQIQAIDEKIEKVLEVEKENKAQIQELKQKRQEFKKATLELTQRLNDDSALAAQLANARKTLAKYQEDFSRLNARNISIQEAVGEDTALKSVLGLKGKMAGIYGTVSELGQVSSKYALALEIVAGQRLKSVVVADDRVAAECIKYLKTNKLGTATFLPLNKVKAQPVASEIVELKKANGVHGMAIDLIEYDPKFKNIFSYVFGNTLVVETIDVARRIGIGNAKMVTLDGDLAELSGAMQGGYRQRKRLGLGFQEQELGKDLKQCEKGIADAEALISKLEKDRIANEEAIARLREFKANIEADIIKLEKTLNLEASDVDASKKEKEELKDELKRVDKEIDIVARKVSDVNKALADAKIKKQQIRMKITELRNPTLLAELNAFEEKRRELREQLVQRQADLKNIDAQVATILQPEIGNIQKVMKQHDKEEEDFKKETYTLTAKITEMMKTLKEKEEKQRKFQEQFKGLFTQRSKIDDSIKKDEEKVEHATEQHHKIEIKINTHQLELTKVRTELSTFEQEYKEFEGVSVVENKSEGELRKEIGIWEGVITKIGSVNMKALEIFDAVEREYNELTSKKEKLMLEKQDVMAMMNEIELHKKDLFMKTFEVVNEHFKLIFSALMTKGADASLVLENPESPFEGGLLIKVRLTGTRFMDIRSLSGGEKTLTALAFIFSIQEHEPASFYIMDEVDAALDKKNSERLANLVRKYTDRAQYVVISHNDSVISEADTLYGVSMNEDGISNVTSLRI